MGTRWQAESVCGEHSSVTSAHRARSQEQGGASLLYLSPGPRPEAFSLLRGAAVGHQEDTRGRNLLKKSGPEAQWGGWREKVQQPAGGTVVAEAHLQGGKRDEMPIIKCNRGYARPV